MSFLMTAKRRTSPAGRGVRFLLFVLLSTGCSDTDNNASTGDDAEDRAVMATGAAAFCADLSELICDHITECWPSDVEYFCGEGDGAVYYGDGCGSARAGVESGTLDFSSTGGTACRAGFSTASCDEYLPFFSEACDGVFSSNGVAGDGCGLGVRTDWEGCNEDHYCDFGEDFTACPGVCVVRGANGDSCSLMRQCQSLYCDENQQCADIPGLGGSCPHGICEGELACSYNEEDNTFACVVLSGEGGSCGHHNDCEANLSCGSGACHETVATGDTCRSEDACESGAFCGYADNDSPFTCLTQMQVGDDCILEQSHSCVTGAICLGFEPYDGTVNRCVENPGVGDSCADARYCEYPLFCSFANPEEPVCREKFAPGEECGFGECQDEYACISDSADGPRYCRGPVGVGGTCLFYQSWLTCEAGLHCEFDSSTCQQPAALGEFCNWWTEQNRSCDNQSYCECTNCQDAEVEDWDAECVARLAVAELCEEDSYCAEGLTCGYVNDTDEYRCSEPAEEPTQPDTERCWLP